MQFPQFTFQAMVAKDLSYLLCAVFFEKGHNFVKGHFLPPLVLGLFHLYLGEDGIIRPHGLNVYKHGIIN